MKRTFTPEEKINYLFGLMSADDRITFESALVHDEQLRAEIDELSKTHEQLMDVGSVRPPLVNPETLIKRSKRDWKVTTYQSLRYAAMLLLFLIVFGSLNNLQIRYDNNGLSVSMSILPKPNAELVQNNVPTEINSGDAEVTNPGPQQIDPATLELLRGFQEQQAQLIADVVEQERADQRELLQELFTEYAIMIENRRMIDMELIQYELDNIAARTTDRQNKTDLVLTTLIESISTPQ
jgi:hypothetical protein